MWSISHECFCMSGSQRVIFLPVPPAVEHLGVLKQEVMIMNKWETKEALLFLNSLDISLSAALTTSWPLTLSPDYQGPCYYTKLWLVVLYQAAPGLVEPSFASQTEALGTRWKVATGAALWQIKVCYLRLNSLWRMLVGIDDYGGKSFEFGSVEAGSPGFHQWQVPELSEGTMAVKPLTELRNGLLSSKACIQAPVFSDQSASRAERVFHPVPTWQPAAVMSLLSSHSPRGCLLSRGCSYTEFSPPLSQSLQPTLMK